MKTKDMALIAILTAFMCICSPLAIPLGPIPLTLATFVIYIIVIVADFKCAALSVLLYIIIGAVGLPVFSGFSAGLSKLTGVTGGYIVGYIPCALTASLIINTDRNKKWVYPVGMVLGTAVCYALGTLWYMFLTGTGFLSALLLCVVPFLAGDAVKIACASLLALPLRRKLAKHINK